MQPRRSGLVPAFLLLSLCLALPLPLRAEAPSPPAAPPGLAEALAARLAGAKERRAAFVEEKYIGALTEPLRSSGRLLWRAPSHLERITTAPRPESLVVDGDRLVITEGGAPPRVVDLAGQPELRALVEALRGPLSGDLAGLAHLFEVRAEGSLDAWILTLAPRDPAAAKLLRLVRIEGTGADLRAVRIVQANGDEQRMTVTPLP